MDQRHYMERQNHQMETMGWEKQYKASDAVVHQGLM